MGKHRLLRAANQVDDLVNNADEWIQASRNCDAAMAVMALKYVRRAAIECAQFSDRVASEACGTVFEFSGPGDPARYARYARGIDSATVEGDGYKKHLFFAARDAADDAIRLQSWIDMIERELREAGVKLSTHWHPPAILSPQAVRNRQARVHVRVQRSRAPRRRRHSATRRVAASSGGGSDGPSSDPPGYAVGGGL